MTICCTVKPKRIPRHSSAVAEAIQCGFQSQMQILHRRILTESLCIQTLRMRMLNWWIKPLEVTSMNPIPSETGLTSRLEEMPKFKFSGLGAR